MADQGGRVIGIVAATVKAQDRSTYGTSFGLRGVAGFDRLASQFTPPLRQR